MRRALAALGMLAVAAPAAHAYVAPGAAIVSASSVLREQGDDASAQPDLSSDGRYVVFSTLSRNLFPSDVADPPGAFIQGGIFRRDLATGALDLVALGSRRAEADGALLVRGAGSPSISGDGRYVAFSTGEALVAEDANAHVDIYLRDMTRPAAYELISARDGTRAASGGGAELAPAAALSDDGRRVAFSVPEAASDIPGHEVPPGQVFVRDRETLETRLVTRASVQAGIGAPVLSADGSTVAWAGQQAQSQTPFLPAEGGDGTIYYYLWQRIADGPDAPTRRVTGAVDLDDPGCSGGYVADPLATGPCYGALADTEQGLSGIAGTPPALSGDGRRVAFLTQSAPRGQLAVAATDAFVTDMSPGVSRKTGTIELTREGSNRDPVGSGPVTSVALSPDGRWAGLVTQRTRFVLPWPRLEGGVRLQPDAAELYLVDLVEGRIERAVRGADGSDADDGVGAQVSLSAGARRVAFVSGAADLLFGDANQRPDVFVVDRLDGAPPAAEPEEPAFDLPEPLVEPQTPAPARLAVTVRRAPAGKIRLLVRAPGRGTLKVAVRGRAPDRDGVPRGPSRLLASRTVKVTRKHSLTVDVGLAKRYRTGLRRARTLEARATATFTPATGAPLARAVGVRFSAKST